MRSSPLLNCQTAPIAIIRLFAAVVGFHVMCCAVLPTQFSSLILDALAALSWDFLQGDLTTFNRLCFGTLCPKAMEGVGARMMSIYGGPQQVILEPAEQSKHLFILGRFSAVAWWPFLQSWCPLQCGSYLGFAINIMIKQQDPSFLDLVNAAFTLPEEAPNLCIWRSSFFVWK
jgi:hypothetical protein